MRTIPILLLLVAACSKDDKDEAKKDEMPAAAEKTTPRTTPSSTTPETAPPPPSGMGKVTCDEALPQAARDKYFGGAKPEEQYTAQSGTTQCMYQHDGKISIILLVCPGWGEGTFEESMKYARESMSGKDLAVGKHGFSAEKHGMKILQYQDDDAPCYVTITGEGGEELAKEIATNMTVANSTP